MGWLISLQLKKKDLNNSIHMRKNVFFPAIHLQSQLQIRRVFKLKSTNIVLISFFFFFFFFF